MKSTRSVSKKMESRVAKALGGRRQPNSGATLFAKGDVIHPEFLIECKTSMTEKQSVSIKREWIDKLREEAFAVNRPYYALAFNFGLEAGGDFYIINEDLFNRLIEAIRAEEN